MDYHIPEYFRRKRFIIPAIISAVGAGVLGVYEATRPNPGELKKIELVSAYEGEHGLDRSYKNLGFSGLYGYNNKDLAFVGSLELECTKGSLLLPTIVTVSATSIVGNVYLDARLPSLDSEGDTPCTTAMDAITSRDATNMMGNIILRSFSNIAENDRNQTNNDVSYTSRELTSAEQVTCSGAILEAAKVGTRTIYPC